MFAQYVDGKELLCRFLELMATGNRRAALAFRDSLPPEQLEAYFRTFKSPWITGQAADAVGARCEFVLALNEIYSPVEMLRDLAAIAAAHGIRPTVAFDENRQTVRFTCNSCSDMVCDVMQAWIRGYTHEPALDAWRSVKQGMNTDLSRQALWAGAAGAM